MFNYFKQKREERIEAAREVADREAAEREAERAHQRAMLDGLKDTLVALVTAQTNQNRDNVEAMMETSRALGAQAESFQSWLKMFQPVEAPTTSVIRDEDEYNQEQARVAARLGVEPEDLDDMPEEFKLALQLRKGLVAEAMADN